MFRWLKRIAAPVAAIAMLGLASVAAKADSVSYHTVVFFTQAGTNSTLGGAPVTSGVNASSGFTSLLGTGALTGDFVTAVSEANPLTYIDSMGESPATFGHFLMNGATAGMFDGAKIQIDVYQDATSPLPGVGSAAGSNLFLGSATATFRANFVRDIVVLTFDNPVSFTLPGTAGGGFPPNVVYRIDTNQTISPNGTGVLTGTTEISGGVAEAPLPATANIGLSLLGGVAVLGGLKKLRDRRMGLMA